MSRPRRVVFGALYSAIGSAWSISVSDASYRSFTREEVANYDGTAGKRFMVTYKGDVFDLTDFKSRHPGGDLIEQAAGSDVEPFWAKWAYHFDSKMVKDVLQQHKVGVLSEDEDSKVVTSKEEEYTAEPSRDLTSHFICSSTPLCTQTHPEVLSSTYITSTESLYVRNHAPVPQLSYDTHQIHFSSENEEDKENLGTWVSLKELSKRFKPIELVSVLQCAGNRQTDDFKASGPNGFTGGVYQTLQNGMVGNVVWKGYRLDRILRELYYKECSEEMACDNQDLWHVVFTGADEYESSTPLSLILNPDMDCLLAISMNGEELSPDHGYPIRALLPGEC